MKPISKGKYTFGDPVYITEILYGYVNETGNELILFLSTKSVSLSNYTIIIDISYYIVKKYNRNKIDRIAIQGSEIDHIFPTIKVLKNTTWSENGKIEIETNSFDETTSDKESFKVDDKNISISFGISVFSSLKIGTPPLNLNSTMFLEFEPTDDFQFIIKLIEISRKFIQYLCYRKNIIFSEITLNSPSINNLHEKFAYLYKVNNLEDVEEYPIEKERLIKYEYIAGSIGKIIDDIANNKIYLRHLPETYETGRHKTAASFVMITSAFEWEFKRNYPSGIKKSTRTVEAETHVKKMIEDLINKNSSKEKKILNYLYKHISDNSLEAKIIQYGEDYNEISDVFGNHLYHLNNEELDYKEIGKRVSDQRNSFAHVKIDQEFINLSLLDLIYLEYIVYIIQLKYYKIPDIMIKHSINDLFGCNLLIKD